VPKFLPFRGIRYVRGGVLDPVCAPPYDVIEPEERAALLARDPHNSVRLILPDTYEGAAAILRTWQEEGVLGADATPSFSVYRMTFTDESGHTRSTTGVIGALGVSGFRTDILPHERTLPKAKTDRLELLRATRTNTDPIWGLSVAHGLSALIEPTGDSLATARDDDGVLHELWRVDSPERVEAVSRVVGDGAIVLADGHHRFETAVTYAAEREADNLGRVGDIAIMALVVELADEQLWVQPIHRMISGVDTSTLRDGLSASFDVRPAGANVPESVAALEQEMTREGALGLVDSDGLALLVPRPELGPLLEPLPASIRDVDAARFDVGVLPALGDAEVTYRHDAAAAASHVDKGTVDAAVLLRAVTVDQIRAAAGAGVRMPQKTTFFAPKPRTGMVFRSLDL
jgi:uncharacterized protein (DUF1015 family)